MKTIQRITLASVLSLLLGSCAGTSTGSGTIADAIQCPAERPQLCTMDYRPVCAVLANGDREEFSNGCGACSVPQVVSYVENACPVSNN